MNKICWWQTSFGQEEIQYVAKSITNAHISQGPVTMEFERRIADILGVPYAVATTSGSTAILMALIAVEVGPGDEVIVPNRTWIATAHAPLLLGAKVILVDVEAERPIIDITKIEEKITKRTKAIIPVHLNGRSAKIDEINHIASSYRLRVIEDAAQAFCSRNADGFLGCQSDIGCFSLAIPKLISTGQGGVVVTKNKQIYERLKLMRTHGVRDVINASYTRMGFNFRFTDIHASIGIVQLRYLSDRIAKVKSIYIKYSAAMHEFPFLRLIPVDVIRGEIPIYIEVLCQQRNRLVQFLADHSIQTRPFYPDLDTAGYLGNNGNFPHSRVFSEQGLFLPCGPGQSLEDIERVLVALREFRNHI